MPDSLSTTTSTATSVLTRRHERLAAALQEAGLDALVLNPGPGFHYMTGLSFHLMERPTVVAFRPGAVPGIVLPAFEAGKVEQAAFEVEPFSYDENPANWTRAFERMADAKGLSGARIGVEPRALRFLELRYLEDAAPGATFVSGEAVLTALRGRKDAAEVEAMRRAVDVAQRALEATLPAIRPGVTEQEAAAELVLQLLRAGSSPELPFQPIVAFGPNSANPHSVPSDRTLAEGDLVLFDWGAGVDGYFSDLTRVFAMGEIAPELRRIAEVCEQANAAGRVAARPGVRAGDVDRAARQVIEAAGYGAYFTHRTGHGLGLESHEEPYIRGDNDQMLEPGMTFTVEPGIYLPGRGGVRIEDDMVITEDGAESLSTTPRGLRGL